MINKIKVIEKTFEKNIEDKGVHFIIPNRFIQEDLEDIDRTGMFF